MNGFLDQLVNIAEYTKMMLPQMMEGLGVTLQVFALTLIFAIPLGILVAVCRLSRFKVLRKIMEFYILLMRGTPLLLQIIFIFFGFPILNIAIPRMPAALLAFSLNYAAYFAEIFRAGISSIDQGQYEGAEVLGLSKQDTFFRIILPQAFKRVLPPIANEVITLVKDTALVYAVGFDDLLKIGKTATNRDASLLPLVLVAVIYLLLILVLSKVLAAVEKKYDYYK
ncbi:amino acid ABC transporter permease [Cellulosilyticum sp. ST5]|uniref:amino acid ABC transporter permease n=1 Tax=Cellulosilyticum sp. ST5 TaxID=3055805 RepID=UPI00397773DA